MGDDLADDQPGVDSVRWAREPLGEEPHPRARSLSLRIVAIYVVAASCWILVSDSLLARLHLDHFPEIRVAIGKGLAFVVCTAMLLHWRLTKILGGLEATRRDLAEIQERFRRAVIDAPLPAILFAEDGQIVLVNRAWTEITGYPHEEIPMISDWTRRAYGSCGPQVEAINGNLFALDHRVDQGDFEIRARDGTIRIWAFSSAPVGRLRDGRRLALSMAQDVTERRRVEDAYRQSEARFRTLVESSPIGIFIQIESRFAYANPCALSLFGATESTALIGKEVLPCFHPTDQSAVADRIRRLNMDRRSVEPREERILRPDGSTLEVEVMAVPFRWDGRDGALVFARNIEEQKAAARVLEVTSTRMRTLSRRLLDVQERERRHLARELHDEIGQRLTAVKLDLECLLTTMDDSSERLDDAISVLDETLRQVRSLALELRPSILDDLGLVAALGWFVERFQSRSRLTGDFRCDSTDIEVDPEVATAGFRAVQEALTNIARHARAQTFSVELISRTGAFELTVRDDGVGFKPELATSGLGLLGMRERVEQVGGEMEIQSIPGAGTTLRLRLPVRKKSTLDRGNGHDADSGPRR